MTEKEMFIDSWEREFNTTMKVLKAYPAHQESLRPHERSRNAAELAWTIVSEEPVFVNGVLTGKFDFESIAKPPASMQEIVSTYEKSHRELVDKVKKAGEADLNTSVKLMVARDTFRDVRRADVLWMTLMDTVHHRGQFSVYLRMAGGKVPSIYGPSGDEPWQ
jgi:uncharacterized damage-inducible protein DinB